MIVKQVPAKWTDCLNEKVSREQNSDRISKKANNDDESIDNNEAESVDGPDEDIDRLIEVPDGDVEDEDEEASVRAL